MQWTHQQNSQEKVPVLRLSTINRAKKKLPFPREVSYCLFLGNSHSFSNGMEEKTPCFFGASHMISCFTTYILIHRSLQTRKTYFRLYSFTLPRKCSKRKGAFMVLYNSRSSLLLQELQVSTMPHKLNYKCYCS